MPEIAIMRVTTAVETVGPAAIRPATTGAAATKPTSTERATNDQTP
jgi:hypothetical protein